MTTGPLTAVLSRAQVILLDFDGPICSVFASYSAPQAAEELRKLVTERFGAVPPALVDAAGPLQLLRRAAELDDPAIAPAVADALRDVEVTAVSTAEPTLGAIQVLQAARDTGRQVVIVSNNSVEAIRTYLARQDVNERVDLVVGRHDGMDPRHLKPDPYLVTEAMRAVGIEAAHAVLVGDSTTDVQAARTVGVAVIGYANKPGKATALKQAGANLVVGRMSDVSRAINSVTASDVAKDWSSRG